MSDTPDISVVPGEGEPAQSSAAINTEAAIPAAPEAEKSKRATRSRKKAEEAAGESPTEVAAGAEAASEAAAGAEPAPKKKRTTTAARKTRAKSTDETRVAEDAPAIKKSGEGEAGAEGEEAPVKRRRTTRKAAAEAAEEGAQAAESAGEGAAAPAPVASVEAEEKPKRATRKRTTTKKTEASSEENAEATAVTSASTSSKESANAEPAVSAEASAEEVPAAKPRRTRRKGAEESAEEAAPVAATADAPLEHASAFSEKGKVDAKSEKGKIAAPSDSPEKAEAGDKADRADSADEANKADGADKANKTEKEGSARTNRPERTTIVRRRDRNSDASHNAENKAEGENNRENRRLSKKERNEQRNNNRHQKNRPDNRNREREVAPSVSLEELAEWKVADLRAKAAELNIDAAGTKKADLVEQVYQAVCKAEGFFEVSGVLDIVSEGYGFIRTSGYLPGEHDVYVGLSVIRRNGLRKGDMIAGQTRPSRPSDKYAALHKVTSVNGKAPEIAQLRPRFADLTPVFPDERLLMEHGKDAITARVIDLTAPIGKGQRGLIVSPPKAGKTTVLKDIAAAITANNPEVHLMYLGIDERPEEATDMERSIRGEVVSSTFDMPCENHIQVAELVIERAKRLVEQGEDVVILLDSITRLARAYNLAQPASGRILSGGVDSTALYPPKRFLGAARNIENGGSLTILASALIETGSKMDEVIFEEFKGTGNMELKLDRSLADRRIFPAIDPITSGTRKEELLLDAQEAPLIWAVRRILSNTNSTERAMDMLIKSLKQTKTNQEFLIRTAKKAQTSGRAVESIEL
jgi:transcription termination factor Rho